MSGISDFLTILVLVINRGFFFFVEDLVAMDGKFYYVWGTSASAPVFGSIITLINDARAVRGKRSVGFVNPTFVSFDPYLTKEKKYLTDCFYYY